MTPFHSRSRIDVGTVAATDIAMSGSKISASTRSGDRVVLEQQVQLVVAEQAQVIQIAAADEHPVVDAQDLGVRHLGMEQDLDAGTDEALVVVSERRGRIRRCRLARGHDPDGDAALCSGQQRSRIARFEMYGLTMSMRSLAASRACSIASLIG